MVGRAGPDRKGPVPLIALPIDFRGDHTTQAASNKTVTTIMVG
jgi:hypothetical protein